MGQWQGVSRGNLDNDDDAEVGATVKIQGGYIALSEEGYFEPTSN